MKENFLVDLSKQFAVDIVNLCTEIKENRKSNVLLNQVLRSGTSIGANIHEANYAASKADFINKFQIALKECGMKQIDEIDSKIEEILIQKIWDIEEELDIQIDDYRWDYKGF